MSSVVKSPNSQSSRFGPHGGLLVAIESGFVEISVLETDVPPIFRLYFFEFEKKPQSAPVPDSVTIETVGTGEERQTFRFRAAPEYLESTANIPEPHEFVACLIVSHGGHGHVGDSHWEGDHGHADGDGFLGWLGGIFCHSHSVVDKIDDTMEASDRGIRALKLSLLGLGVTALFQFIIALISGSVALLANMIHNFTDAGTSLPLWIAFALAKRGASRRFTYGYGKTEDVVGVVIVLIIFSSACVAANEATIKIIHPQTNEPCVRRA